MGLAAFVLLNHFLILANLFFPLVAWLIFLLG